MYPSPTVAECDDTTPFKFTGYERDTETNLDDANARYFASSLARFMSSDPAGMSSMHWDDPQTLNRYAYVSDNPLTLTDPTGMDTCIFWIISEPCQYAMTVEPDLAVGFGGTLLGASAPSGGGGDPSDPNGGLTGPCQGDAAQFSCSDGSTGLGFGFNYSPCTNEATCGNTTPEGFSSLEMATLTPTDDPYNLSTGNPWLVANAGATETIDGNTIPLPPPMGIGKNNPFPEAPPPPPISITASTPFSTAGYAKSVKACISEAESEVKASKGAISFTDAFNACVEGL